jgi:hypothetical protein
LTARRRLAAGAFGLLLLLAFWRDDPRELGIRAQTLFKSAGSELAVRRMHGSGTGFDRQFFVFLESARRLLPAKTAGVALLGKPATNEVVYLANYVLAPVPVLVAPTQVPGSWLLAVYGTQRPPGWKVVAPVWRGALMAPGP